MRSSRWAKLKSNKSGRSLISPSTLRSIVTATYLLVWFLTRKCLSKLIWMSKFSRTNVCPKINQTIILALILGLSESKKNCKKTGKIKLRRYKSCKLKLGRRKTRKGRRGLSLVMTAISSFSTCTKTSITARPASSLWTSPTLSIGHSLDDPRVTLHTHRFRKRPISLKMTLLIGGSW